MFWYQCEETSGAIRDEVPGLVPHQPLEDIRQALSGACVSVGPHDHRARSASSPGKGSIFYFTLPAA